MTALATTAVSSIRADGLRQSSTLWSARKGHTGLAGKGQAMFTFRTIARGFAGLDHTDIAWTDHHGAATQYIDLNSDEGTTAVMRFLRREGVENYRIILESTEIGGSTFRVDVPEVL